MNVPAIVIVVVSILLLSPIVITAAADDKAAAAADKDPPNVPTFLSVRELSTGRLRYAPQNDFYEELLRRSTFIYVSSTRETTTTTTTTPDRPTTPILGRRHLIPDRKGLRQQQQQQRRDLDDYINNSFIWSNKQEISHHESLRISWTTTTTTTDDNNDNNNNTPNHSHLHDDDIVALYCPSNEPNAKRFKDVISVRQIRQQQQQQEQLKIDRRNHHHHNKHQRKTTTTITTNNDDDDSRPGELHWDIPSFPIIREETCEFRLWRGDVVAKSSSSHDNDDDDYDYDYDYDILKRVFTFVAKTNVISIRNARTIPTGIHLSLTTKADEMRIHFTTGISGRPIVSYAAATEDGGNATTTTTFQFAVGESTTYKASDMCQAPASIDEPGKFSDPGMIHTVTLTDLDPNTVYTYKVGVSPNYYYDDPLNNDDDGDDDDDDIIDDGSSSSIHWSSLYTFRTSHGTSFHPHSFLAYADQGIFPKHGWNDGRDIITLVHARETTTTTTTSSSSPTTPAHLIHQIGDLSYSDGASHVWDAWLHMISPLSTSLPLMVGVGNHEYDHSHGGDNGKDPSGVRDERGIRRANASGGECGVPFAKRFDGSGNGNKAFWYSFETMGVHTVVLSSQHDMGRRSRQYRWLKRDLRSVERRRTPWLIVEIHSPFYNSIDGNSDYYNGLAMRESVEHLLKRFKVNLVIAGHNHVYLRTCDGLYEEMCDNGGPMHVVVGTGGVVESGGDHEFHDEKFTKRMWRSVLLKSLGYGRVTVANRTALHWEFVNMEDGVILDDVWIYR